MCILVFVFFFFCILFNFFSRWITWYLSITTRPQPGSVADRLFYLSIPPNIFVDAARCASLKASSKKGWTRVIVEKPFGRDSESSGELTRCLKQHLAEDQIFRIDHYLGKELVENLSVLRFSNLVFEPLWSRNYIRNVQLIFSEDFGTEGRGGSDSFVNDGLYMCFFITRSSTVI